MGWEILTGYMKTALRAERLSSQSTFAEALERHFPRSRRCSQDDLGNKQLVEELAHQTLRERLSPCIDRTNFNAVSRVAIERVSAPE